MLSSMPRLPVPMLPLLLLLCTMQAHAHSAVVKIARVITPVATLDKVELTLAWPDDAREGRLRMHAARVDAAELGYHFSALEWECPLRRDGNGGWQCDGLLRAGGSAPAMLSINLASASTDAVLSSKQARLAIHRRAATPDDTTIELSKVPLAWVQALSSQAWAAGHLRAGSLDGHLVVHAPEQPPLRVSGHLRATAVAIETPDGSVASERLDGGFDIDYRSFPDATEVSIDGRLSGGEFLYGTSYISLTEGSRRFAIDALRKGDDGWMFPRVEWNDGDSLRIHGSAGFTPATDLQTLDVSLESSDLGSLSKGYLSGWLAIAGLSGLQAKGALEARIGVKNAQLAVVDARLYDIALLDPGTALAFDGLDGSLRFSDGGVVDSQLQWTSGSLAGIPFGAATLPWRSSQGDLDARADIEVPMLAGVVRFEGLHLRLPRDGKGFTMRSGLVVDQLELGRLSAIFGGPPFSGTLSGTIPVMRYADDRLDFDGGLTMQLFDGRIDVSALAMERPFGVAPSLTADFALHDLDLRTITGVFDLGSINGRLEGRIDGLRLVDWSPAAFDAELHTIRKAGVRQRISQRAVQGISSVGDASFVSSVQGKLIGMFDDFGYANIGISCRLSNEVCSMGGLHSAGAGFTIVEGAGIPRLDVVGFNHDVDWPTLVERVMAATSGDVAPVIE